MGNEKKIGKISLAKNDPHSIKRREKWFLENWNIFHLKYFLGLENFEISIKFPKIGQINSVAQNTKI